MKGHRMWWAFLGSPTQVQVVLVIVWGPQSEALSREGLEGLSGIHLSGRKARPVSRGGEG